MTILIIGLGSIAKKHINAIKSSGFNAKFFALRSSLKADQFQNITNVFSLTEISKIQLDFCIISSPTFKHSDDILKLINLGVPLFIEKPLFNSLNNASIIKKVNDAKIKTYIACNLRFLDSLNFVKNEILIKNNKINEVNIYCGSYLPDWRPNTDYKLSYSANTDLGGGAHLDLIHELDYCYWLFGKPISVIKTLKTNSSININSIDYANYLLEYKSFMSSVVLNYYRRDTKRILEIIFDDFTITVDLLTNSVYKNQKIIFKSNQNIIDTYKTQIKYFIDNINNDNFNDIDEAYEVLKICLK